MSIGVEFTILFIAGFDFGPLFGTFPAQVQAEILQVFH